MVPTGFAFSAHEMTRCSMFLRAQRLVLVVGRGRGTD